MGSIQSKIDITLTNPKPTSQQIEGFTASNNYSLLFSDIHNGTSVKELLEIVNQFRMNTVTDLYLDPEHTHKVTNSTRLFNSQTLFV